MMNETTFQGDGKVAYVPVVVNAKLTKPSNADRIRAMSDEELAKVFADYVSCHDCPIPYCKVRFTMERLGCQANWLDWLKQEVSDALQRL